MRRTVYVVLLVCVMLMVATPTFGYQCNIHMIGFRKMPPLTIEAELGNISFGWWNDSYIMRTIMENGEQEIKTQTVLRLGYVHDYKVSPTITIKPGVGIRRVYHDQSGGYRKYISESEYIFVPVTYYHEDKVELYGTIGAALDFSPLLLSFNANIAERGVNWNIKTVYNALNCVGLSVAYYNWPSKEWYNGFMFGVWIDLSLAK